MSQTMVISNKMFLQGIMKTELKAHPAMISGNRKCKTLYLSPDKHNINLAIILYKYDGTINIQ